MRATNLSSRNLMLHVPYATRLLRLTADENGMCPHDRRSPFVGRPESQCQVMS
jgi:hypothetical protein